MIHATLRSTASAAARGLGALALLATLAGCSFGTMNMTGPETTTGEFQLQGRAYGGSNPDVGATVQVWTAGTSGYGAGAATLGSAVTTDSNGYFSLSGKFTCPTATTQVYVTATGGNPGLSSTPSPNPIRFVAAMGNCSNLSNASYLWINEVTTAAAAYALSQYATTNGTSASDSIGAPSSAQATTGLGNAFLTAATLVNTTNGTAQTSITNGSVTIAPESPKLYTVADMIASCSNSTGGSSANCSTLFSDVTPTGGTQPSDTFEAAVLLNLNPTSNNANGSSSNIAALYGLENANSPFVYGGMTSAPTDWTLGVSYTSTTTFPYPQNVAVDAGGNVWVTSNNGGASGALGEMSPSGSSLAAVSTIGGQAISAANPRNIAIDLNGNAWMTTSTSSAYVVEYGNGGAVSGAFPTSKSSYGIAVDASGNVWVSDESSSAHVQLYEFPSGTTLTSSSTYSTVQNINFPTISTTPGTADANGTTAFQPEYLAFDTNGNLWMSAGSATSSDYPYLVELTNINTSACTSLEPCWGPQSQDPSGTTTAPWNGTPPDPSFGTSTSMNTYTFTTSGLAGVAEPYAIAAGPSGVIWAANTEGTTTNTLSQVTSVTAGTDYGTGSNVALSNPKQTAVDGSGNVWIADKDANITGGSQGGTVSEFSSAGTVLSPTSTNTATTNPGYLHAGLQSGNSLAIDQAGNVWVADATSSGVVFEIVGAASPTVQPLAEQLVLSKVGAKP